jgi:hypothetical protein
MVIHTFRFRLILAQHFVWKFIKFLREDAEWFENVNAQTAMAESGVSLVINVNKIMARKELAVQAREKEPINSSGNINLELTSRQEPSPDTSLHWPRGG